MKNLKLLWKNWYLNALHKELTCLKICTSWVLHFRSILLLSHYFSSRYFSYHGMSISSPFWKMSVSSVISHHDATLQSLSNLWPPTFFFGAGNIQWSPCERSSWYNHNQYRFFSYKIMCHVKVISDRPSYLHPSCCCLLSHDNKCSGRWMPAFPPSVLMMVTVMFCWYPSTRLQGKTT